MQHTHITYKELVPVVLAAAVWGREWAGLTVQVLCDNLAVVADLNSECSKDAQIMHLLRCLSFDHHKSKIQVFDFSVHLPGVNNNFADTLSRDNLCYLMSNHPQAERILTPLPLELLDLTLVTKPDWTSAHWTGLWTAIFEVV